MELIQPKTPEIWEQGEGFVGMCEHIARCASVCYDSEPKKGGEAVDFVKRLFKMGHGRALEFGTVYLFYSGATEDIMGYETRDEKQYISYNDYGAYVTMNLRTYLRDSEGWNAVNFLERNWTNHMPCHPKRVTIHYPAISRAIADEFRTHTTLSTLMQSTRYVDKGFGNSFTVIEPRWVKEAREREDYFTTSLFRNACGMSEKYYKLLMKSGMKRQEARDVLPLCVSTEMVQCGFVGYKDEGWDNFLRLRTAKEAHPDARWMAKEVHRVINDWQSKLPIKE
jgi:hypothetical protein